MTEPSLYGGIEAGGTKFVCVVAGGPGSIAGEARFETQAPGDTLQQVCDFFLPYVRSNQIRRIGLGSFGPVDLEPGSPTYGYITSTPKAEWQNTNIAGILHERLGLPVVMDTDVNAAALGEHIWGASQGIDPSLYLTVGTGIGGGLVKDGRPYHGLLTPEMGHLRIPHDRMVDPFSGACPYHGDCLEGLASGPAIEKRMGRRGESLEEDDPFWELEAGYLAHGLTNCILAFSPGIIILGGGVMSSMNLLRSVRLKVQASLNGYVKHGRITDRIEEYIVPPMLGERSGVLGAIALAMAEEGMQQ